MTDPILRDSGSTAQDLRPMPPFPAGASIKALDFPGAAKANPKIFASDQCYGPDALDVETFIGVVAKLAAHKYAETPFCIGILGAAGTGKSFVLAKLSAAVEALAARAAAQAGTSYLSRIEIVHADAALLDGEPMTAIAGALCEGLTHAAPDMVEEALRALRDPYAAVAEAAERLDQIQRKLLSERDHLSQVESRRARLFETVLYETPGSQIDAYAKTFRPRIANRLQAFGFSGDPILNYKDLVASLATVQGPVSWVSLTLRAFWAFRGQTRLLVTAMILALAGWGLNWAAGHQASWLAQIRASNDTLQSVAAWFETHMRSIVTLGQMAFIGAGLAICVNLWRAFRFLQPVLRGVTLLKTELANRQHELDSAYAHQTRRVDGLAADVERAARLHAEADEQAGKAAKQANTNLALPFQSTSGKAKAIRFMSILADMIAQKQSGGHAPQRILFMLDNLDAVSPARACDILDAAHGLLTHAAFVTAVAANPQRLADAGHGLQDHLEKWIQVPVRIDAVVKDHASFVMQLAGQDGRGEMAPEAKLPKVLNMAEPSLDRPLSEAERQLLSELAPLAGASARSLKRFVNVYRLTRTLVPDHWASLAFLLALKAGGTPSEIEAVDHAMAVAKPGADLDLAAASPRLSHGVSIVRNLEGDLAAEGMRQAAPVAASFSF